MEEQHKQAMYLTLLGTGNANVTECYNTCFVIAQGRAYFMVDGGGGSTIMKQIKQAGYDWLDMRDIFVTHNHIDHLLGVFWMMRMICQSMTRGEYEGEARIYGHDEVISMLYDLSKRLLHGKHIGVIGKQLQLIEVKDKEQQMIIGHPITFFDVGSTKDKQFGFSIELEKGEKLTCCGDEPYRDCEEPYAKNSKWLLHEAFCLYAERERFHPYKKHHSTVKDACESAERLQVQNLVLYHTEDHHIAERKQLYVDEGRPYFSGNLWVPDDLETILLS